MRQMDSLIMIYLTVMIYDIDGLFKNDKPN